MGRSGATKIEDFLNCGAKELGSCRVTELQSFEDLGSLDIHVLKVRFRLSYAPTCIIYKWAK